MATPYMRALLYLASALYPSRPDREFDQDWYFAKHPDVAAQFTDGWAHFVQYGDLEGRAPNPSFDPSHYARTHLGLEEPRPYRRYINAGRRHGLLPAPGSFSAEESRVRMQNALRGVKRPIILVGNDAQRAGAPLLLLELAMRLKAQGLSPVFILKRGGPIIGAFLALGPAVILDEGWDASGLGHAIPSDAPVIGNTGWSAPIIEKLGRTQTSTLLVHEMPDYLVEQDLLDSVSETKRVIVGLPRLRDELSARLPDRPVDVILGALRPPAHLPGGRARTARFIRRSAGRRGPVFLGAGFADARKGFDLFLDAAWAISATTPNAIFVWLGDLSVWARRLAEDSTARGLVLLTPGFRTDAADWYANADVYVLTSRQDPGPTTVMDAANVGVPFVGYAADIGLRGLDEILHGVGVFVEDRDTLAATAVAFATTDTPAARRRRRAHVRKLSSFDRYSDEVLAATQDVTPATLPRRTTLGRALRLAREQARVSVAMSRLISRVGTVGGLLPFARQAIFRPEDRSTRPRGRIPATVAIAQSGAIPASALSDREAVAAIGDADAEWLSSAALLRSLTVPVGLHVVRERGRSVWPLVIALQRATKHVLTVDQYDVAGPPHWVLQGEPPPPARAADGTSSPPPVGYPLAPHGPVRLARPIGVFIHAYYLDLLPPLIDRLRHIDHPAHLYVSTDSESKAAAIRELVPDATVRVFVNRGRDIYPKIYGFADAHRDHDVVLHLHTKQSPHNEDLALWNEHILDRLLPSTVGVNAILALFESIDSLGMAGPTLPPLFGVSAWWGPNRPIADLIAWDSGWPELPDNAGLRFPAGSMFWARSAALVPVQNLAAPPEAFISGLGSVDGTLAHAIERLIGVSCGVAGLGQLFLDTPEASRWSRRPLTTEDVADLLRGRWGGEH